MRLTKAESKETVGRLKTGMTPIFGALEIGFREAPTSKALSPVLVIIGRFVNEFVCSFWISVMLPPLENILLLCQ